MRLQSGLTRATQLGIELDDVRQRIEPWYTDHRIECKVCTVEPGGMCLHCAARRQHHRLGVRCASGIDCGGGIPQAGIIRGLVW